MPAHLRATPRRTGVLRRALPATVLAAACALAGCGSGSGTGASSTAEATTPAPAATYSTQTYQQWEAQTHVTPREYSDSEAADLRAEWLDGARHGAAEDLPTPDLIAWSDPGDWSRIATCITEAGFPTEVASAAGGITANGVPSSQESAHDIAVWTCMAQYTPAPAALAPWGEDQLRVEYEYYTTYYLDCMASLGVDLDRSSIPSEDVWVAQAQSGDSTTLWLPGDETTWSAAAKAAASSSGVREKMDWVCPPTPPAHAVFGT